MHSDQTEQLFGWIQYFENLYDGQSLDKIADAENLHILLEDLGRASYEMLTVERTHILMLNSSLSADEQRRWLIGALAARKVEAGNEMMIRMPKN